MKVAVVGYGYWGPNVVRSLCQLVGPESVVVCDSQPKSLERARAEQPGITTEPSWPRLLDDGNVDALCLCTPAGSHYRMACEALAAGKHLLVEKPFTTSSIEARVLFDDARRQGLVLMAGHLYLHSAPVRALKGLIDAGELGEVRYLYSRRTSLGPRAREEVSVVWDYLAHDAYILPHLLGDLPAAVCAHGGDYLRPGIADVVFATMHFAGSVVASCQASWYDPHKVRDLCVVGSEKMAIYDDMNAEAPLVIYDCGYLPQPGTDSFGNHGLCRYDRGTMVIRVDGEPPLLAQCRAFVERVAAGAMSPNADAAVLGTIALLEAVDDSLADGGRRKSVEQVVQEKVA